MKDRQLKKFQKLHDRLMKIIEEEEGGVDLEQDRLETIDEIQRTLQKAYPSIR